MLRTVLQITGLARTLGNLKLRLEDKAAEAVTQVKGIAVRIAVAAALAIAAVIFTVLALIAGLAALYAGLQPVYGVIPALGIVGGTLMAIALLLVLAAALVGRGKPAKKKNDATVELAGDYHEDLVEDDLAYAPRPSRRRALGIDRTAPDAASLLQSGDRRTMIAVLSAVAAAGWLLGKTARFGGGR